MSEIKAFVAHSFSEDDKPVVLAFLQYFDQIRKIRSDFSWEHAESAEPRELREKVLSLIAGKNVCIAICTKSERAIPTERLAQAFFLPAMLKGRAEDFRWKTTDWIIQEIGLAVGRGLDLIIILEEDVRPPGGLQGNIEYIPFKRSAPEKAFGKLLEMVQALTPKPPGAGAAVTDNPQKASPDGTEPAPDGDDWLEPKPTWDTDNYRFAMFHAIYQEEPERKKKISDAYLATAEAAKDDNTAEWHANIEYLTIHYGKDGSLETLKRIATDKPNNSLIASYLARAYAKYGDTEKAVSEFEVAADKTSDPERKLNLRCRAAVQLAQGGDTSGARAKLEALKADALQSTALERQFLASVVEVATITKDEDTAITAMERIVEIAPDDIDTRFSLAFKHSDLGNIDLALCHYLKIPYAQRGQSAWNNLGVALGKFSMPGKSVAAYRKAEEMGETLAMSNLGYLFLHAGFLREAESEFAKGLAIKDFHQSVGEGIAALKNVPSQEEEKQKEVVQTARPKGDFYRLVGRAFSRPDIKGFAQRWSDPDCELTITVSGRDFRATGSYERDGTSGLALAVYPNMVKTIVKYRVEYKGQISGGQIEATVRRVREGDESTSTILGLGNVENKALMLLTDDGAELKVMENPHGTNPRFYSIRKVV